MNIYDILLNLYINNKNDIVYNWEIKNEKKVITSKSITGNWINTIDKSEIQPFVIQKFLAMDDGLRKHTRWLDKYVFSLQNNSRMYLSLAWSILPKVTRPPFIRYIKTVEEDEEYDFILSKVKKQYKMSDNDFNSMKSRILEKIKNDTVRWFSYYGVPKKYWNKYYLKFDLIKDYGPKKVIPQRGLEQWGL